GRWQFGLFNQVYLTLGLRGERNPAYGTAHKVDWTPSNGATYTLTVRDVTIKLLGWYGRSTRAPGVETRIEQSYTSPGWSPAYYVTQFANRDLRPEISRGPQGGVEVYFGNVGAVTVNRYKQTVDDLIQSVLIDSIEQIRLSDGFASWIWQSQ